jgi:hypothetical protein
MGLEQLPEACAKTRFTTTAVAYGMPTYAVLYLSSVVLVENSQALVLVACT